VFKFVPKELLMLKIVKYVILQLNVNEILGLKLRAG
jgi:hypothetical protein